MWSIFREKELEKEICNLNKVYKLNKSKEVVMKKYLSSIEIPVEVTEYMGNKGEMKYMVSSTEETLKHTGNCGFVVSKESIEEAKRCALLMRSIDVSRLREQVELFNCLKPLRLQKSFSSYSITIFGIMIWFRKATKERREQNIKQFGYAMKGGCFIPFTNVNISITNRWKTRYKDNIIWK